MIEEKEFTYFLAARFYYRDKLEESDIVFVSDAGKNIEWQGNTYIQTNLFFEHLTNGGFKLKMHFPGGVDLIDHYLINEDKELRMNINMIDINKLKGNKSESSFDCAIKKIEKDLVNNIYTFIL